MPRDENMRQAFESVYLEQDPMHTADRRANGDYATLGARKGWDLWQLAFQSASITRSNPISGAEGSKP